MSPQVRVGGYWLSTIAPWGELQWSHAADGGCKEASWRMDAPPTFSHPALARPNKVEIFEGAGRVWQGVLTEPDVSDDWTLTAKGLSQLAGRGSGSGGYLCLDGSGNSTSKPDTAIDRAISVGLPWVRPTSISSAAFATNDQTTNLNKLGDLLDAWADNQGKRWGVDEDANVYVAADPTTPTWYMTPGSGRFGLADDEYASDLYGRYIGSSGYATVTVGDATARGQFGRAEEPVDLTSLGLLTSGQATTHLNGLLAKGKARQGYTTGAEVNRWQLTTPGGTPAHLAFVKAGQMVRMLGVLNEQGQPLPYVEWVIGESHHAAGAGTVQLTPAGLVARDFGSAISLAVT